MYENYFEFKEFVTTSVNADNVPTSCSHLSNIACLWDTLNQIREELGQPIIINSAYRSPQVNEQVGGAKRSLHMQGRAADIRTAPLYMDELWTILNDPAYEWSELIKYSTFYHVAI